MNRMKSERRSIKETIMEACESPLGRLWPYVAIAAVTIAVSLWMQWDTADMFPNGDGLA